MEMAGTDLEVASLSRALESWVLFVSARAGKALGHGSWRTR